MHSLHVRPDAFEAFGGRRRERLRRRCPRLRCPDVGANRSHAVDEFPVAVDVIARHERAVLDTVDPGADSGPDAVTAMGVRGHRQRVAMGRRDGLLQRRGVVLRVVHAPAWGQHSTGGHHLDDIDGPSRSLIDGGDNRLDAVCLTTKEPAVSLPPGDRWSRHDDLRRQPRSPRQPRPRVEGDIAAVTEVAQRRNTCPQRDFQGVLDTYRQCLIRLLEELRYGITVGIPTEVNVTVDETGQNGGPVTEIPDLCPIGRRRTPMVHSDDATVGRRAHHQRGTVHCAHNRIPAAPRTHDVPRATVCHRPLNVSPHGSPPSHVSLQLCRTGMNRTRAMRHHLAPIRVKRI